MSGLSSRAFGNTRVLSGILSGIGGNLLVVGVVMAAIVAVLGIEAFVHGKRKKRKSPSRHSFERDVRNELSLGMFDPETSEYAPEKDDINDVVLSRGDAARIIKDSYLKTRSCHATIKGRVSFVVFFCLVVFLGGGIYLICTGFSREELPPRLASFIFGPVFVGLSITFSVLQIRRRIKIYDVYLLKIKGKNIVFYIGKKHAVYYRSRTQLVCISDKRTYKEFTFDEFMDTKLCWGNMAGNMSVVKKAKTYEIKTRVRKKGLAFPANSSMLLAEDLTPISARVWNAYIYDFKSVNDPAMKVTVPRELLEACDKKGIPRPPPEAAIRFV